MKLRTRAAACLAAVLMLLSVPACQKLDPEALALLKQAALAAKERAVYFAAVEIPAKDPAHAEPVAKFVAAHREGLAAQAKGLADLVEAVENKRLSSGAAQAVIHEAETAGERARNFAAMLPYLNMPDQVGEVHAQALSLQAQSLAKLAEKLKPKKDEKPKDEKPKE